MIDAYIKHFGSAELSKSKTFTWGYSNGLYCYHNKSKTVSLYFEDAYSKKMYMRTHLGKPILCIGALYMFLPEEDKSLMLDEYEEISELIKNGRDI